MIFPSKERVMEVLRDIEEREKRGEIVGARMLPDDATELDKLKHRVCRNIVIIKLKYDLPSNEIAEIIGASKYDVSRVINYRIDSFSLDKLMNFYFTLVDSIEDKKVQKALKKELDNFLDKKELKYG